MIILQKSSVTFLTLSKRFFSLPLCTYLFFEGFIWIGPNINVSPDKHYITLTRIF